MRGDTLRLLETAKRCRSSKHGFFVVKNAGDCATRHSTKAERLQAENDFFKSEFWASNLYDCGMSKLESRVTSFLEDILKREMWHAVLRVQQQLVHKKAQFQALISGPTRAGLETLATRFQYISDLARSGKYFKDHLFVNRPALELKTRFTELIRSFSNDILRFSDLEEPPTGHYNNRYDYYQQRNFCLDHLAVGLTQRVEKYPELAAIFLFEDYKIPATQVRPLMDRIKTTYEAKRDPQTGSFGPTVFETLCFERREIWEPLTLLYTSKAIAIVHEYSSCLMEQLCQDQYLKGRIWKRLTGRLCEAYRRAMDHARFLLRVERRRYPSAFDKYLNSEIQNNRHKRLFYALMPHVIEIPGLPGHYIEFDRVLNHAQDRSDEQHVCEDVYDMILAFEKSSQKRFVDTFSQQVLSHFLLGGDESALKVFCPGIIPNISLDGPAVDTRDDTTFDNQRQLLKRDVQGLEAALKILRS
ncbi:hypothetical protein F5Y15DRAFT_413190 [Xylariaceae sp. FL0016]|nr:hypothetical protein F5Y15DRAFT_413190 [Xylariaceae sp. FL0016]